MNNNNDRFDAAMGIGIAISLAAACVMCAWISCARDIEVARINAQSQRIEK